MSKHDNFEVNFSLKGFASIQIGIYILIAAYLIKNILTGFLIDDNPVGMLSVEIIEIAVISILILTFLFSSMALYFKARRASRRFQHKIFNSKTKKALLVYVIFLISTFTILISLKNLCYVDFITPSFLILYGIFLFFMKHKSRKNILIISLVSVLLAALCIVIPSYWYSSLFILGITHITYGVVVKH